MYASPQSASSSQILSHFLSSKYFLYFQDMQNVRSGCEVCSFVVGMMCIVKPDGPPQLCKTDEIGEICVSSRTGGMMYYGLTGVTKNTFEVCNL